MGCSGCEWDPRKNRQNWRKHRIRFEDACCVFEDPGAVLVLDDRDYGEERWIATGNVASIIIVVIFVERNGMSRIISARQAKRSEENRYYGRLV